MPTVSPIVMRWKTSYQVYSDDGEIELMAPGLVTRGAGLKYGTVPSLGHHDTDIREEFWPETP